jgi:DNA-binding transcriptional MerR regulator
MATTEGLLSISEAARVTGLSAHTLRYYERAGLMLDPVGRAASAHRRYTAQDIAWIVLITRLRATGMPIRTIGAYAELVRRGEGTEAERLAMLERHREAVLARLEETRAHLEAIDHKIDIYREKVGN